VPAVEGTITQPLSTNESQPKEQGDKGAVQQGVDAVGQGNAEREVTVLDSAEVNTILNVAKDLCISLYHRFNTLWYCSFFPFFFGLFLICC